MEFLLEILGMYLLYKFIFDLVIPMVQTTSQVKKQFEEMQHKMKEQQQQANQQQNNAYSTSPDKTTQRPKSDYIDFEEVK